MNAVPAALLFALAAAAPQLQSPELAKVIDSARRALHVGFDEPGRVIEFRGTARFHDEPETLRLLARADGSLLLELQGKFEQSFGLSCVNGWEIDASGAAWRLDDLDLQRRELFFWVWNGRWCDVDAPLRLSVDLDGSRAKEVDVVAVETPRGRARIELAKDAHLALRLVLPELTGETTYEFSDWSVEFGREFPHHVVQRDARGAETVFELEHGAKEAPAGEDPFWFKESALWSCSDAHFAAEGAPPIASRLTDRGVVLVEARVDGEKLGWFALDTGSSTNLLSTAAREHLKLETFGRRTVASVGGSTSTGYARASSLALGALTVDRPLFLEYEPAKLRRAFGEEVAGVLGADFLRRAVVDVDYRTGAVAIHDPATERRSNVHWSKLSFERRRPYVAARVGRIGTWNFQLDTGGGADVVFYSPVVKDYQLLKDRKTSAASIAGAEGDVRAVAGTFEDFEFAGLHFDSVDALFSQAESGAFADPAFGGVIGAPLLKRFVVVFDYPNRSIGFLEREH